ncbi:glycosyltransferase family 4 protein [Niveibacterium umoris]|uniref:Glycosyltransferase involved in cell wall biosynthesis n=1 Tax=Niveibacterium umoris TaxID=1193620 RepID=A0A840BI88_9RHOO|nr:glycosyltransferase family 4 protein [Niveibacterium umoris]MBB4012700.1 glycosyltransferase involved in cell wall biosynthesis [Niveibacterium umoris]
MRIVLFANTDWFLWNFKLSLARALRDAGHEVILLSPAGEFGERLRGAGFDWRAFPLSRSGIHPVEERLSMYRLLALYRKLKPDLVHHFTIKCVLYGSWAARKAHVPRVVNSITGLGFALLATTWKARMIRPVVVGFYRRALVGTQVIFQNRDNRDTLAALGALSRASVHVIPGDGVDTRVFAPPTEVSSGKTVLMMGRLLSSKGVAEYVAAARIVRQRHPDARLLLAGAPDPGNPESIDEHTLQQWRDEASVEFLGHRSDVVALQQHADIAVLASTQGEGMPRALLEAASCGKPMVATDVPGSRELVVDGVNGLLVPPGDPAALAAAILALLDDPARAARMGAQARADVLAELSDERIVARTLQVYGMDEPSAVAGIA